MQIADIRCRPTTKEKTALQTRYGIKDRPNPLLELPVDLHR